MSSTAESSPLSQSSVGSKARVVSRRGQIWSNFTEEIDATGCTIVVCRKCKQVFKHPSMASTLSYHWIKKHPNKEQPPANLRRSDITSRPRTKKEKIQQALTSALAIPGYSISMFVHPLMRGLFTELNPNVELPRSFDTLKCMLVSRCAAIQKSVKAALGDLRVRPSITCDVWSDSNMKHSYMGITLHCIDKATSLRRVFLGLKELQGSHTGFLLRAQAEELLSEYGFNTRMLYKVVTDSGSNMISAFKDILLVDVKSSQFGDEYGRREEEDEEELDWLVNEYDGEKLDLLLKTAFPMRIRYFAHSLQLVILKFFDEQVNSNEGYKVMRKLIGKFRHSVSATTELDELSGKTLLAPSGTRWASFIKVIGRYLEVSEAVNSIAIKKKWTFPNADQVHDAVETKDLACALGSLLDRRFSSMTEVLDNNFDSIYIMAAAFDPNTVHLLSKEELNLAISSIQPFVEYHPEPSERNVSNIAQSSELDVFLEEIAQEELKERQQEEGVHASAKSWIGDVLKRGITARASSNALIDVLKYWFALLDTEYQSIAILALEVLSVPATSAPIERIFSLAGLATRNQRNRTELDLLNSQLIVYCNLLFEKSA